MMQDGPTIGEELIRLIEGTANMLRGMTLDPAIPQHAKDAMHVRIQALEEALSMFTIEGS